MACFFKLVARILKSEPLIFYLLICWINALKISFQFFRPKNDNFNGNCILRTDAILSRLIKRFIATAMLVYSAESIFSRDESRLYRGWLPGIAPFDAARRGRNESRLHYNDDENARPKCLPAYPYREQTTRRAHNRWLRLGNYFMIPDFCRS